MRWRLDVAMAIVAAVAVYVPAIGYGLVFDDHSLIGPGGPRWLGTTLLPYRPLRYLSLWLDHAATGGSVAAYHGTNIGLHAVAAGLVVVLANRLGAGRLPAALAGALFAVHPLGIEAVAYVAGRRDVLALALALAGLALWIAPRPRPWGALALAVAATASKETGGLVVVVYGLASLVGLGPMLGRTRARDHTETTEVQEAHGLAKGRDECGSAHVGACYRGAPILAPMAAAQRRVPWSVWMAAALVCLVLPVVYGAVGPLVPAGSLTETASMAVALAGHYASKIVWPTGLSVEYPTLREIASGSSWEVAVTGTLVVSAVLSVALAALWRLHRRSLVFALLWVVLVLGSIVGGVGAHEPGADRHAYPLLAALAVLVAIAVGSAPAPWRHAGLSAMAVAVVAFALTCQGRLPVWRSDLTLWRATVQTAPGSARAHYNLASVLAAGGRPGQARRHLLAALAADPAYGPAYLGLAALDCVGGRRHAAVAALARARELGVEARDALALESSCMAASPEESHGAGNDRTAGCDVDVIDHRTTETRVDAGNGGKEAIGADRPKASRSTLG